jgi:hypothetical protein
MPVDTMGYVTSGRESIVMCNLRDRVLWDGMVPHSGEPHSVPFSRSIVCLPDIYLVRMGEHRSEGRVQLASTPQRPVRSKKGDYK